MDCAWMCWCIMEVAWASASLFGVVYDVGENCDLGRVM